MSNFVASFAKRSGSKAYQFIYSAKENFQTVSAQFCLSLELGVKHDTLTIQSINNVKLRPDERYDYNTFKILMEEALKFRRNNTILCQQENLNCYITMTKPYTKRKALNSFKKINYSEYKLKHGYLYILDAPLSNNVSKKSKAQTSESQVAIQDIKDFSTLQKRALELEQDIKQLKDGIASYKKSTVKSIDENARLTDKLDNYQKVDSKLNDYLQKHYSTYLDTDAHRLSFLQNLLDYRNSANVQKLVGNSNENLLKFIRAICNYSV